MLGVQVRDRVLHLKPCIPPDWPFYRVKMRIGAALYDIEVRNPDGRTGGVSSLALDGRPVSVDEGIALRDDGGTHAVVAILGP
jgi:cellobiose phosphorylase